MENAVVAEGDPEASSAIEESALRSDARSANAMRMVELTRMLAAAETAILVGNGEVAAANLKQLERCASLLAAELCGEPAS